MKELTTWAPVLALLFTGVGLLVTVLYRVFTKPKKKDESITFDIEILKLKKKKEDGRDESD